MTLRWLLIMLAVSACASPASYEDRTSALHEATTVVALTFDDTFADNFQVGDLAADRGMNVTFYVNSARPGTANYMTRDQMLTLQAQGHEIGGHTITHARLTAVTEDEARRQVCNDRVALTDMGFRVTSFAYPFGANNALAEQIVEDCGYNSARDVGGLVSPGSCSGCPYANTRPPAAPYALRTGESVGTSTTLAQMQQHVTQAEQNGGGFVPIVFHHVCDGCSPDAVTPATLAAFIDWLAARGPATQVGTVDEIIGGDLQPPVSWSPPTANMLQNASLEIDANGNQVPDCWQRGGTGTNTATYTLVNDAFDGAVAQRITVSSFSSGARRLVSAQDTGACAPPVTAGRQYTMTAYYKATTQPRFSVYYRTTSGAWAFLAQSPLLPTSSAYRQATYTTPAMPSGATAISIGLSIFAVGTITMDAHTLLDAAAPPPDTTPPVLTVSCNGSACASSTYTSPVSVSLSATDAGSGVREIRYTTDGSDPASGTLYTAPFTVTASSTVRSTAVDNANNRTSQSTSIVIGAEPPPPAGNLLQNASLEVDANANQIPDCWQRGGYGTNSATYTLVSDAFDGSVAQRIDVASLSSGGRRLNSLQDTGACAPSVTPGQRYIVTGYYKSTVQPRMSVYIRSTSGAWRYLAESAPLPVSTVYRQATYTTPAMPTDAVAISVGLSIFSVGSLTSDAYTLVDESAPPPPPPPPPDTTPPSLEIACNGSACATTPYTAPVQISLTASDASGIAEVRFTTDGSDPATGTLYTAPFTVTASATVRATALDTAGNRTTQSASISIAAEPPPPDTTPPSLAIACNGGACASSPYTAPVQVTLTASDSSGIAEVRYTLDGSDPTTGTLYTAPFTVNASATVQATAVDNASNRSTQSVSIVIDDSEPPPPANLLQNASLELDANANQIPDCWKRDGYGTNTVVYTLVSDAFDGAVAQRIEITSFSSGGRRLASAQDQGACAPAVTPGRRYTLTAYYKSTVAPRVSVFYRNASGTWVWFAESAALPVASVYTQATYTTPVLPAGATAISIGLSIFAVGALTTDAYSLVEVAP